jgi:hypothetical protein
LLGGHISGATECKYAPLLPMANLSNYVGSGTEVIKPADFVNAVNSC